MRPGKGNTCMTDLEQAEAVAHTLAGDRQCVVCKAWFKPDLAEFEFHCSWECIQHTIDKWKGAKRRL